MTNPKTKNIALLAVFIAIVILQNIVPIIGSIPMPWANITIIPVTVGVASIVLGPKFGAIVGGFWGITSLIQAFMNQGTPMSPAFMNPMISIFPRIMVGVVVGYTFIAISKTPISKYGAGLIGGFLSAFTNTVIVLGMVYLFIQTGLLSLAAIPADKSLAIIWTIVTTNGIIEAIASAVLVPLIALPLKAIYDK